MLRNASILEAWLSLFYTSVSKVAKQLAGAISLLNSIRGGELVAINKSQNDCRIKIE